MTERHGPQGPRSPLIGANATAPGGQYAHARDIATLKALRDDGPAG